MTQEVVPVSAEAAAAAPSTTLATPTLYNWYALGVLTLIGACHTLDRTIIGILAEDIKQSFELSDSQLGLLTGLAFAAAYAFLGIPIGYLIDRVNRRNLLAALVSIWSAMTAFCGIAQSFAQLVFARVLVGAAEAGGSTTPSALISDLFGPGRRQTALGIYFISSAIGPFLGFLVGGIVAANYGWRTAFFVAGVPGIILALILILTIKEPVRGASEAKALKSSVAPSWHETLVFLWRQRSALTLIIAFVFITALMSSFGIWLSPFFIRSHGLGVGEVGVIMAVVFGGFTAIGAPLWGTVADRLARRDRRWHMWVPALAMALCVPATVILLLAPWLALSIVGLALYSVLYPSVLSGTFAQLAGLVTPHMRGTALAILTVSSNLAGYGLGPQIVGVLSDLYVDSGPAKALRYALLTSTPLFLIAAVLYYRVGQTFLEDQERAAEVSH